VYNQRASWFLGSFAEENMTRHLAFFAATMILTMAPSPAGARWQVLAVNDLGDEIHATPALSGGRIYVRTRYTLYSFGSAP
jgi:hypothetical protein